MGESSYYLEIEKGYNKYMEEEDYIHSTQLTALFGAPAAAAMAARLLPLQLTLSLYSHVHSHSRSLSFFSQI